MRRTLLAAALAAATLAPSAAPAAAQTCPPGSDNPDYCPTATPRQALQTALQRVRTAFTGAGIDGLLERRRVSARTSFPVRGKLTLRVTARSGGRTVTVASGTRTITRAGTTYTLTARVTSRGAELLRAADRRKRSLRLTARGTFVPRSGSTIRRTLSFNVK